MEGYIEESNPRSVMWTGYEADILDTLKECETWRRKLRFISPQLAKRSSVVELIRNIGEEHYYRRTTVHLAIHLLDVFMSNHFIVEQRLNLVALTCFYVACKIEENEPKVPSPRILCSFVEETYTPADITALEVTVLNFFNWHVTIPTAATFIDMFALYRLRIIDYDYIPQYIGSVSALEEESHRLTESSLRFLDATLLDVEMNNIKPSLLAAACVAASRYITPHMRVWSDYLTSVTGYEYEEIHLFCLMMISDMKPQSPSSPLMAPSHKRSITDSAYLSESSDNAEDANDEESTSSCDSGNRTPCSSDSSCSRGSNCSYSSSTSSSESEEIPTKRQKISNDKK